MPVQLRSISFRRPLSSCDLRGRWKQRVAFDEMHGTGAGSQCRVPYRAMATWLGDQSGEQLKARRQQAEALFRRTGITFAVYGAEQAEERLIPFDIIPRMLSAAEWRRLAAGIEQRVRALNAFMYDIYHRQEIIARRPDTGGSRHPERGVRAGDDGRRAADAASTRTSSASTSCAPAENEFFVLEDNTRTPSGVSYMLENRETMMHMVPDLFGRNRVAPVEHYPEDLRATLESVAPAGLDREPVIAVLTPGEHNSAYFEHSFLADRMGVELVEGRRSGGDRRRLHDEDHAGPAPGRCHLPADRRRLPRSPGVPIRFDARRAGAVRASTAPGG